LEGQELAARHIALREQAGLTQEQEAKMAGVSPTTISGIESGKITRPHLKTLLKIARALGADVGELRESGKVEAAPSPTQPPLNGFEDKRHASSAGTRPWAAYSRQVAGRVRGHANDPDSPAFRDPWAALFFVEEANRNAADLSRFVDEQLCVALELADVEAMHELMAAFEDLCRAIDAASARARSMEAGRSSSELGEARRRAEEAAAERESAAAGLSVHSGRSA
jgi:transcriptional regulator with XRE-family HTH domain